MAPPAGQALVLAVLGQGDAEPLGVVEGAAHERPVLHAGAVVGEERHAEGRQLADRGQGPARPPDRDGAGHRHLGQCSRRPRASTSRATPAESMAGSVFGMATMAV